MVIIGDAVAGANFERSEPLVAGRRQGARQADVAAMKRAEQIWN